MGFFVWARPQLELPPTLLIHKPVVPRLRQGHLHLASSFIFRAIEKIPDRGDAVPLAVRVDIAARFKLLRDPLI